MKLAVAAALVALVIPAFVSPALAQKKETASPATKTFVQKAAISDMFEQQSSRLVLQKSKNDKLKDFANMMIADHGKTSDELKANAKNIRGARVPLAIGREHKKKLAALRAAKDTFDADYKAAQIAAHQDAIKTFSDYSEAGDNAALKKWAGDKLPKLREHLSHAQGLDVAKK